MESKLKELIVAYVKADAIPNDQPIAQLKAIAEDMTRLHRRMVKEAYPQMNLQRTAA